MRAAHARDDELLDAVEGVASEAVRRHVQGCAECFERVEEARHGWELAREAEVPEPSPLYWQAFRRQVGGRLGAERRLRRWLWAPALATAAALALAVGLLAPGAGPGGPTTESVLPAWSASLPAAEDDERLAVLAGLTPPADELPVTAGCLGLAQCLSDLTEEETVALADVLRQELAAGGGS